MCKALANPVDVAVFKKDSERKTLLTGKVVGTTNLPAMFKDNQILCCQEEQYTAEQIASYAEEGAYPGTALNQPVVVLDDEAHTVLYGWQVNFVSASLDLRKLMDTEPVNTVLNILAWIMVVVVLSLIGYGIFSVTNIINIATA